MKSKRGKATVVKQFTYKGKIYKKDDVFRANLNVIGNFKQQNILK